MFGNLRIDRVAGDVADAFCAQLPRDRFLDKETALINLLKEVAATVEAFMPPGVSLQDWAARRIPEDEAERANASRMVHIGNTGSVAHKASVVGSVATQPAVKARQPWHESQKQSGNVLVQQRDTPKHADNVRPVRSTWRHSADDGTPARQKTSAPSIDTFFDALPSDSFLPWELSMKEALAKVFNPNKRRHRSAPPGTRIVKCLTAFTEHPQSGPILDENLPASVSFEDWVLRRVGGEFDIQVDAHGNKVITTKEQHSQELDAEDRAQQVEDFFLSLPQDSFSEEEVAMRDAIFAFIDSWSGSTPSTTNDLGYDPAVQRARLALLPHSLGISIRRWCECRMGEELEFLGGNGTLISIGYPGQWKAEDIPFEGKKKRRVEG